ncbi:hypothetical protein DL766_003592 [Monosporascus sp. MC13-8B]|uniref:MutL C-terminal dimerisation domain-containing protein n=1 Tax=Monosporascus cannonballus TaxID=155416 RepID=A0ABY0GW64_9PEZI|nr:hypothetical protein DL762_009946 [Monosporascus cannonballus]RYO77264.1 hypothetical protein DL763_010035 [Monosporascus cannonballus]RYP33212.1 hypothetical protein DL766_003592 [Monosporascus sp. MC13-8B]
MSIQRLPKEVIGQIKSSTTITSLSGVVCGLVKNSLDAEATKIAVSVDYARGNCSVEDNGLGIPPAEFKLDGDLGKLHSRHTPSPPELRVLSFDYGTRVTVRDLFGNMPVRVKQRAVNVERGADSKDWESLKQALVALLLAWPRQVSIVLRDSRNQQGISIRSSEPTRNRHLNGESYEVVSRVCSILQQAQLSNDAASESWVPLRASAGHMSVTGAISLVPVATRRVQFITIGVRPVSNHHGTNFLYEEINKLFSNSSFGAEEGGSDIDEEEQRRRAGDGRYKSDGYTGRELRARKSVDRWPMFYIKLNLEGSISHFADCDVDETLDERQEGLNAVIDLLKAVFYEFLKRYHFRPRHFRPSKSLSLGSLEYKNASGVSISRSSTPRPGSKASRPSQQRRNTPTGDLATTRFSLARIDGTRTPRSRPDSPFDSWTRIKTGRPQHPPLDEKATMKGISTTSDGNGTGRHLLDDSRWSSAPPLVDSDGKLLRPPFLDVDVPANGINLNARVREDDLPTQEAESRTDGAVVWTNPFTKERSVIDSRTGFVIQPYHKGTKTSEATDEVSYPGPTRKLRLQTRPAPKEEKSPWLKDLLTSWDNPVFQQTEPPIPVACDEAKLLGPRSNCHGCHDFTRMSSETSGNAQGKVSKDALRRAGVIAQVDRKFILAKVSTGRADAEQATIEGNNMSLIVVIDQHAADERCRVETLMKEYFERVEISSQDGVPDLIPRQRKLEVRACAELLEKPLKFDISATDAVQLMRLSDHFRRWGIWYEVCSPPAIGPMSNRGRPSQVKVQKLPPSIAERCRLEPRLLIELLRKEAWKEDEHAHGLAGPSAEPSGDSGSADPHWQSRLHGCPQGVLDMINSRACRSSIMFNDELSYAECVDLVKRLADCAFPFQCAHGRPSMVPLLDLGRGPVDAIGEDKPGGYFGREFKRWKARMEG